MAGKGALPKPQRVRDADNRRRMQEFTILTADGEVRGPELPDSIDWPEQTRTLYEALRRDPVAQVLTDPDWLHVIDTMSLHRLLWIGEPANAMKVAAEVRLRLQTLGVTPEARMRMRLHVDGADVTRSKLADLRARQEARGMTPARRRALMKTLNDSPSGITCT